MRTEIKNAWGVARLEMTTYTRSIGGLLFALFMPTGLFLLATWLWYPEPAWGLAVPHITTIVVLSSGLFSIGVAVTQQRLDGTLRTYLSSPLSRKAYFLGQVIDRITVTIVGIIILIVCARLFRGVFFDGNILIFLGCVLIALINMILFGFLLASRYTSVEVAGGSSSLLFIAIFMLSGYVSLPIPDWGREVISYLPFEPVVKLLEAGWSGNFEGSWQNLGVCLAWSAIFLLLTIRFFKWSRNDR